MPMLKNTISEEKDPKPLCICFLGKISRANQDDFEWKLLRV